MRDGDRERTDNSVDNNSYSGTVTERLNNTTSGDVKHSITHSVL